MTDTAQKIMNLIESHQGVKPGMVLGFSDLSCTAKKWGQEHVEKLREAMEELRDEGYVIITATNGLELTERGYDHLFSEEFE